MTIRCVVFDLGNVLIKYRPDLFYELLRKHSTRKSVKNIQAIEKYFSSANNAFADYELGKINNAQFFDATRYQFGLKGLTKEAFFFGLGSVMEPDFEMLRIKQLLMERGIQLALLTNNDSFHMEIIPHRWPSALAFFKVIVTSYDAGFRKPDPQIYEVLFEKLLALGITRDECLFVDDVKDNILAFRQAGGMGYHYDVGRRKDVFAPEDRLDSERELFHGMLIRLGMLAEDPVCRKRT